MASVSFAMFAATARRGVELVGESLTEPDDDWMPVAFVEDDRGKIQVFALAVGDPIERSAVLTEIVRERRARKIARVESSWSAYVETEAEVRRGVATAHPDRVEVVLVTCIDAERVEGWVAEISRDGTNPPTLGEWEHWPVDTMSGLQIDPIQAALR
jgi:hypothetical protein